MDDPNTSPVSPSHRRRRFPQASHVVSGSTERPGGHESGYQLSLERVVPTSADIDLFLRDVPTPRRWHSCDKTWAHQRWIGPFQICPCGAYSDKFWDLFPGHKRTWHARNSRRTRS